MIILTGSLAYDYIMEFPGEFGEHILPEHTHNINLSFVVNKFAKHRGGTAGNVSYTMGLLKSPHTLFSYAGKDFKEYKNEFNELGIDTKHIAIDENEYTATGFAMTDKKDNQIWGFYYGASEKVISLNLEKIAGKTDLVYIGPQGAAGSVSFINQCIKLKIPFMFDPGFILTQITDTDLEIGITHADYIVGNEYEMEMIKKRVKGFSGLTSDKTLITTLGGNGASLVENGKEYKIKPAKAEKIGSTTGAGDAWRGGFLSGIARNFDLATSAQMGATAGSFAVEHFGTQEHKFTVQEFEKRYGQTYGDLIKL